VSQDTDSQALAKSFWLYPGFLNGASPWRVLTNRRSIATLNFRCPVAVELNADMDLSSGADTKGQRIMRTNSKTTLSNLIQPALMVGVAVFIILSSVIPTMAQKKPIAFESDTQLSPSGKAYYEELAKSYKNNINNNHPDLAMLDRNRLMYLAIDQIDLNFYDFQKNTRKKRALFQTVLDILEIGLSTAISLTNGDRAKTVIAEALGFTQISHAAINKNFSLKDTQILFNKMVSKRADILATMLTKSTQDVEEYPFEASMIDLIAYFKAGTFDGALESLNVDTGAEANEATQRVERIKIATKAELDASIVLRATLADLFTKIGPNKPEDATKTAARNKLKAGLKAVPELLDGLSPDAVDQLTDPELEKVYRKVRQKLVDDRGKMQTVIDKIK